VKDISRLFAQGDEKKARRKHPKTKQEKIEKGTL